jgi:UDPglucose--hexose-1-phosphate uridylyltransferase
MPANEMRKDYLLNRWVVIATERKRRPTDFIKKIKEGTTGSCPFCPDHEMETPPAVLVYLPLNGEIKKEADKNSYRHKNWLIRCFPNLYPAFTPPKNEEELEKRTRHKPLSAIGHHEILVESPRHEEHPSIARVSQLVHLVNAYRDRLSELSAKNYVKHVSIFRNHQREAGASLSHAHSQIIATPSVPRIPAEEVAASKEFWRKTKECIFCNILKREKAGPRFIWENKSYEVFAPWASINPFEFWIFPKEHQLTLLEISKNETQALAKSLRVCFGGLSSLLKDPPYNFGFHMALDKEAKDYYHWHLEVYPRLAVWAGFEKSNCMFINTMPPEEAAKSLQEAFRAEEKTI